MNGPENDIDMNPERAPEDGTAVTISISGIFAWFKRRRKTELDEEIEKIKKWGKP